MGFLYSQFFVIPVYPTGSYQDKTVVVTGSNVGLGKEAARHYARLGASNIILAVRDLKKGNAAKEDIESTTKIAKNVIQVWHLDMARYSSVQDFAKRIQGLERVDIFIANAGIAGFTWRTAEDNEAMITVNVVSTFLLAFLIIPKLKETAIKFKNRPTLTITSSEVHAYTTFPQKSAPDGKIFETLSDEKSNDINDRYHVSKLLEVFAVRALADRYPASTFPVTVNCVNPGLCHSELSREMGIMFTIIKFLIARTTEKGSRTLVHAARESEKTHGAYLSDCHIQQPSKLVLSAEGKKAQDRVWDELVGKLEGICPGIMKGL